MSLVRHNHISYALMKNKSAIPMSRFPRSVEFRALEAFYSGHICILYRVEKLLNCPYLRNNSINCNSPHETGYCASSFNLGLKGGLQTQ